MLKDLMQTMKKGLARRVARRIRDFRTVFWRARLRHLGMDTEQGLVVYGSPIIARHPGSRISAGHRVVLCSDSRRTALALNHPIKLATIRENAVIRIGDDVGISGACIVSAESISIGAGTLLGANVTIMDTDFHPLQPEGRRHSDDWSKIGVRPVELGHNVFVGAGATITKGARIGRDSVVAAAAVVTSGTYPDGAILAGNPAKVIGSVYPH